MYLQLTTKCNMACYHCGFSCSPKRGEHMDLKTYKAALDLAEYSGSFLSIGGGEPTVHPQFWEFLGLALGKRWIESIWLATNGKKTETALALAGLARKGVIGVDLSQDPWHEPIDPKVVTAFSDTRDQDTIGTPKSDRRDIRNVSRNGPINWGRAKRNNLGMRDDCICDELFVSPDGRIWACGCKKEQFGTVFKPEIPDDYYQRDNYCSRAQDNESDISVQEVLESLEQDMAEA